MVDNFAAKAADGYGLDVEVGMNLYQSALVPFNFIDTICFICTICSLFKVSECHRRFASLRGTKQSRFCAKIVIIPSSLPKRRIKAVFSSTYYGFSYFCERFQRKNKHYGT